MRARWMASAVVSTLLTAAGCTEKKLPDSGIQTVQAGTVAEIQSEAPEKYSAVILANQQVDLAFKSGGIIASLHRVRGADGRIRDIEVGDAVSAGTILATVRPVDYEQRIQLSQAGVKQALAQLESAKVAMTNAELDYNRAKTLYNEASLTKPEFDHAQAQYDSSKQQVQSAQSAVDSANTQLKEANTALEDTLLRAPLSGYVSARNVSKGSLVGNSTLGFSLIDIHVVKANFAVPDLSLSDVRLGQKLSLSLNALPNPVTGTITSIGPQADVKSRVFPVEVTLPNQRGSIRPGMIGSLSLGSSSQPRIRLVVPLSAIVRAPGNPHGFGVLRIEQREGKTYATSQPVEIGETFGNTIEVATGLSKGDRIIALGGELVQNGQEIRVLP